LAGRVASPRSLRLASLIDAEGALIDRGLIAWFPGPASFTGEDCAEFHLHGGRAVVAAVLDRLGSLDGLRQAEAGEFSQRAFVNGKLDLTEAEALSDLIGAETAAQRRLAQSNAAGRQHVLYQDWRSRLLHARAMVEAELDFADEGDVPGSVADRVWSDMAALHDELAVHLSGFRAAEIVREGFRVAIVGAPNAGKSSLLNYLAGRDVAIVSDEPGTTRDVLEVALDLRGVKVIVFDTAGIRAGAGKVEAIGIDRARRVPAEADLVLALEDLSGGPRIDLPGSSPAARIGTKLDLVTDLRHAPELCVSTVSGKGIDGLVAYLADAAAVAARPASEGIVPTRQRHIELVGAAVSAICASLDESRALELRAESLRQAGDELGRLTGAIHPEEVLGAIFSSFCIGK
jgi:tRNA modification GTPase